MTNIHWPSVVLCCLACLLLVGPGCAPGSSDDDAAHAGGGGTVRETIATDAAPAAIGPYSQGVKVGHTLYLSGQIGIDPATGKIVEGGIEAETRQVLTNLEAVLTAAGFSKADVVKAQVFLADLDDYKAMNDVYASFFESGFPARAAVQVARVPRDARVEIMFTAVKGTGR